MESDLALDVTGAEQVFAEADVGVSREVAAEVTERPRAGPPVSTSLRPSLATTATREYRCRATTGT